MGDLQPAVNGTDQRLDVVIAQQREILDELRAVRSAFVPAASPEHQDGETIALREPERPPAKAKGRR